MAAAPLRLRKTPTARRLLPAALAAAAWVALAPTARADEIVTRHPETCELVTIKAAEVLPETWTEVEYRERDRGPTKKIPLTLVVDIKRTSGGKDRSLLEGAIQDLERGNLAEARAALKDVAGGGYSTIDGKRVFTSFVPKGAGTAKGKRPTWTAEYGHFFYAKALVLEGLKSGNTNLLEEALLVLEDVPNPAPAPPPEGSREKPDAGTTGGFLGRFKGGNSRWLPDAMHLKALALVGVKRFDQAAAAFEELYNQALGVGLSPKWVYEAKVGPGLIAEAQNDAEKAVQAYERAPTALETLIAQVPSRCLRLEAGRYFSQVRARAAALLLDKAEKAGSDAAFLSLKTFLMDGQPEALQQRFSGRPREQLEALMAGARDPEVQAVAMTGLGMAYRAEKKYDEAILALRTVAARHFAARDQAARALFYLAKSAEEAAAGAKPDVKAAYMKERDSALRELKAYPESTYASR
jgi:tetratricopeptide (TPR) repeat protein